MKKYYQPKLYTQPTHQLNVSRIKTFSDLSQKETF